MKQKLKTCDDAAGHYSAEGLAIFWQTGPLGRGEDRQEPSGAFVETVIDAALRRLDFFEGTRFKCKENAAAAGCLRNALEHLEARTARREKEGVEGTHQADKPKPAAKAKKAPGSGMQTTETRKAKKAR